MISLVAIIIWRTPLLIVIFLFLTFGALEGAFMSSALRKVPDGAWFTLILAFILSGIFILWRWGKEQQWTAEGSERIQTHHLLQLSRPTSQESSSKSAKSQPPKLTLTSTFGGGAISTADGLGIFFDKMGSGGDTMPKVFAQFIRKFKSRPEVIVFFHMRPLSVPTVPVEERFVITRATPSLPSSYRLTLRHGYMDDVLTPDLGSVIVEQLANFIRGAAAGAGIQLQNLPESVQEELRILDKAKTAQTVYVLGKQAMRVRWDKDNFLVRRYGRAVLLQAFLWIRENSRAKLADLDMDYNNLVEVGFVNEI